jgi:hypothetical protein
VRTQNQTQRRVIEIKTKEEIKQKIQELAEKQRIVNSLDKMVYYDGAIDFLIWVLNERKVD